MHTRHTDRARHVAHEHDMVDWPAADDELRPRANCTMACLCERNCEAMPAQEVACCDSHWILDMTTVRASESLTLQTYAIVYKCFSMDDVFPQGESLL